MLDSGILLNISIICIALIVVVVFFLAVRIIQILTQKRYFTTKGIKGLVFLITSLTVFGAIEYCLYHIPDLLMYGIPWAMIDEMGPTGFINTVIILASLIFGLFVYAILLFYFVKSDNRNPKIEG
jgi:hypothetical protein